MKLARIGALGHEQPVLVDGEKLFDLSDLTDDIGPAFFERGGLDRVREAWSAGRLGEFDPGSSQRFGAPVSRPGNVICIGLNYSDHAAESGLDVPDQPVVFFKATNTVVGPNDEVLIPRTSAKTDYEVELGVVMGSTARYLTSHREAIAAIAGYAVSHDVSEREFQIERGGQWVKGKSCETFNPLGPYLVTADEVPDPQALDLRLWVNGELRQNGSTGDMIFDVADIVLHLSQYMVLEPGDLINTGTPAGVAFGTNSFPYLSCGDVVELEIAGLGRQRQVFGQA